MVSGAETPMRSLQLGVGWFPEEAGGANRMYHELWRYLPLSGVAVRGLVAGSPWVARDSGQRVLPFAPPTAPLPVRWWALRRVLHKMLSEWRPGLVASHFMLYTLPALDLIRSYPMVVHFHGPWASEVRAEVGHGRITHRGLVALERAVYKRGVRLVVLSEAFRDILHHDYAVPEERIRVIPGGVEVNRYATDLTRQGAREQLGWPLDRPILLTVRRLVRRMGLENLVGAIKEVRRRVPEALLLIAGTGHISKELSAEIRSLGLEENVRLLGFVPDEQLPLAYRAADLAVVPTVTLEGFGLTAVESLAAGTPVLVTPVGGLPEVVRALSPDLILPASNVRALADNVGAALTGELPLPSAEVCQDYVRARYDWPVVAAQIRTVYEEALS
jgi:glycogen synthase